MGMLYIARHGRTHLNLQKVFQGATGTDPPLDEQGQAEAQRLVEMFREVELGEMYMGTRERHKQTARPVAKGRPLTPRSRRLLNEVDVGSLNGISYADKENVIEWMYGFPWTGGESREDFARNTESEGRFLIEKAKDQNVLAVTSRFRGTGICAVLERREFGYYQELELKNGKVHQYKVEQTDSGLSVVSLGHNLETLVS